MGQKYILIVCESQGKVGKSWSPSTMPLIGSSGMVNVIPERHTMMNSRTWHPLILATLLASCNQERPKQILPSDRFEAVYAALLERGGTVRNLPADSPKHFDADSIFRSFGTSEEAFRSSVDAYRANPGQWKEFFEGVIKRLDEKQKAQGKNPLAN